jgi:hypothetical protein
VYINRFNRLIEFEYFRENLSYGKFNHEVYKRGMSYSLIDFFKDSLLFFFGKIGCKQRERHHSLGVGLRHNAKRRTAMPKSSVCVLQ